MPSGEQPGLGRRLSFVAPTGHRVELFAEMALSEDGPMTRNPELWRDEPHGTRVTRFDHSNLHGPNIDQVVEFFTELLDFSLTEAAETPDGIAAAFLSCSNKAHDIAFIGRSEPAKFHHVALRPPAPKWRKCRPASSRGSGGGSALSCRPVTGWSCLLR